MQSLFPISPMIRRTSNAPGDFKRAKVRDVSAPAQVEQRYPRPMVLRLLAVRAYWQSRRSANAAGGSGREYAASPVCGWASHAR